MLFVIMFCLLCLRVAIVVGSHALFVLCCVLYVVGCVLFYVVRLVVVDCCVWRIVCCLLCAVCVWLLLMVDLLRCVVVCFFCDCGD